tara:strand:+ start:337 stop:624 length:288 start_codon:yes stop_codon:yes gene_type:complete
MRRTAGCRDDHHVSDELNIHVISEWSALLAPVSEDECEITTTDDPIAIKLNVTVLTSPIRRNTGKAFAIDEPVVVQIGGTCGGLAERGSSGREFR